MGAKAPACCVYKAPGTTPVPKGQRGKFLWERREEPVPLPTLAWFQKGWQQEVCVLALSHRTPHGVALLITPEGTLPCSREVRLLCVQRCPGQWTMSVSHTAPFRCPVQVRCPQQRTGGRRKTPYQRVRAGQDRPRSCPSHPQVIPSYGAPQIKTGDKSR